MPRIAAANIEEHVRQQTERITAAAKMLFARQGFHATDLGDVGREVGLARNSIYRYFNNKEALLVECVRQDMEPHLQRLGSLADDYPDPVDRILALVNLQFDMATGPSHATLELIREVREGSRQLRRQIDDLHSAPNRLFAEALKELTNSRSAANATAAIIGGMVIAATGFALKQKSAGQQRVRERLINAVRAIIESE